MSWGPTKRWCLALLGLLSCWLQVGLAWAQPAGDKPAEQPAEVKESRGSVTLRVSETGAEVLVDGRSQGTTPLPGPLKLPPGSHEIQVRKAGFQTVVKKVEVEDGQAVDVAIGLVSAKGKLVVEVEGSAALRVLVDGQDMGPAPFTGEYDAGTYTVAGRGDGVTAPGVKVEIKPGEVARVKLEPGAAAGRLEVRVEGGEGKILVDGEEKGDGAWSGELPAGTYALRVEREGYEPFEAEVEVVSGDVRSETVTLKKAAAGDLTAEETDAPWSFNGLYGGLAFNAMVSPTGAGTTMQDGCDTLGASSCEGGTPLGGALSGYIGYGFAPVGLELYLMGSGDVYEPSARFDGQTEVDINPLLGNPARNEDFLFARVGGGGAVRVRLLWPFGIFRITTAAGAGLVYRRFLGTREATADDGRTNKVTFDQETIDDISAVFSFELAGQVALNETVALSLGLGLWLENATDVQTERSNTTLLAAEGQIPTPIATPPYDVANNTQFFLSPFLGLHFGP